MTPADQGFVHAMLLKHRELATHPVGRPARHDELRAAHILADCGPVALQAFDDFLAGQGFILKILDGLADLGLPSQGGRRAVFYVLGRRIGDDLPPFVDRSAFLTAFRDRRRDGAAEEAISTNKAASVFWCARLWLTLQYFFYDRIDRPPGNLYQWRDALVRDSDFVALVKEEIERMGNQGRPEGEAGLLWDSYWELRTSAGTMAKRFLKLMDQYGMIEPTDEGVWRQSLVAAVDMATIAESSLHYLAPQSNADRTERARALITGYETETESETDHAADPCH